MKSLKFESIVLVSHVERKSKKIEFDPNLTVLRGENDTGKSSVMKSLYYALGAEPHNVTKRWKNADVAVLLKFSLENVRYRIYRHRKSFSLFNSKDELVGTYDSVTNDLGPVLARLYNFNLIMADRFGVPTTPPPAYLYLPFYIDQDKGWASTWNSFKNLSQFGRWKEDVPSYHYGLRPDEWYAVKSKAKEIESELDEPTREKRALEGLYAKTRDELSRVDFDIDVERFTKDIKELIALCNQLRKKQTSYRQELNLLKNTQVRLDAQIEIVSHTYEELSADYGYATETMSDAVDCPMCGAEYENSFAERFHIASDTDTCRDLLQSLRKDLSKAKDAEKSVKTILRDTRVETNAIEGVLSRKQGKVSLSDLVKNEGKKELIDHLRLEIGKQSQAIQNIEGRMQELSEKMQQYDNPSRRKVIRDRFTKTFEKFCWDLNVHGIVEASYKTISTNIDESGSDVPRAILAYNFATLDAITIAENATFFPVVIDAPNQQEQDKNNLKRILNFIPENIPDGSQLILGLVDDCDIKFQGKVIDLTSKYSLLQESSYEEHASELSHYERLNLHG